MSSLYLKYLKEKKENEDTYYLFKVGNFYIFIDEDAKKISEVVPLKLTNLTSDILKCGFPINALERYLTIFKNLSFKIKIIEEKNINVDKVIKKIKNINIEKIWEDTSKPSELRKIFEEIEENYSIKISEYNKEFYKQGFIDGVNLMINCIKT